MFLSQKLHVLTKLLNKMQVLAALNGVNFKNKVVN